MTYDVTIAGAGPVGLFLACELCLQGVSVLVLERAADPHSRLKRLPFGLRGLTEPTIAALDRRDLLTPLLAAQDQDAVRTAAHWLGRKRLPLGHFAGIMVFEDRVDWPGPPPRPMVTTDIASLETILTARAEALGATIRRGHAVTGFEQDDHGVTVLAGEAVRTRWLVGCDGGRSAVRKAGGFDFAGTDPEFTGYSIEADLDDPAALTPGRNFTPHGMYTFAAPGTIALVEFDGGAGHRAEVDVQAVVRRVTGATVAIRHVATWTDRARQATTYRKGRVLLAGDAAHVHSPLGGQGLNLGIGDAVDLGWKLAATIQGPDDLLDSYTRDRHPVGARILDWSRAQVALMRPGPGRQALAAIIADLIDTRDGATYFATRLRGIA